MPFNLFLEEESLQHVFIFYFILSGRSMTIRKSNCIKGGCSRIQITSKISLSIFFSNNFFLHRKHMSTTNNLQDFLGFFLPHSLVLQQHSKFHGDFN